MRSRRTPLFIVPLLLSVFLLTACPSRTNIAKINADPDRYRNKDVAIAGTVTDGYGVPFLGGAYELDDGTGKIWVVSRSGAPTRGAKVGAKGRIITGFTFRDRNFGTVLEESDRRSR
ncbi:MAG: hypothetical protein ACRD68_02325 [Pyrinomonadaceae bacterium]